MEWQLGPPPLPLFPPPSLQVSVATPTCSSPRSRLPLQHLFPFTSASDIWLSLGVWGTWQLHMPVVWIAFPWLLPHHVRKYVLFIFYLHGGELLQPSPNRGTQFAGCAVPFLVYICGLYPPQKRRETVGGGGGGWVGMKWSMKERVYAAIGPLGEEDLL